MNNIMIKLRTQTTASPVDPQIINQYSR